uniref:Prolactin releasing hormone receptor 2b n=1 Tax=Cyprinus carpio carpio TaxID=630221 RepID=A0A8C1BKY4_CYPCA
MQAIISYGQQSEADTIRRHSEHRTGENVHSHTSQKQEHLFILAGGDWSVVIKGWRALAGKMLKSLLEAKCMRKMHNVTNFFIGNLAFSDMLMCVSCVPFTLAYAFSPHGWTFGRFMCYLVFLIQPVTVYVSVFTLTAIAVDRYYATVHPLKKRISMAACAYVLSGIWLLSCVLVAPAVAHTYHVEFREEGLTICEEFWLGQETQRLVYAYSTLLLTYILPLSAVCVSYLCISVKLRNCVAPGHRTRDQAEAQRARKRKIFRLVSLVVAAFGVCWLPIHVFNVLRDIDIRLINKRHFLLIQLLCHLCAMSSSCCNPFLYAWLHDRFRAELRKMFTCHRRIGIPANHCATASVVL